MAANVVYFYSGTVPAFVADQNNTTGSPAYMGTVSGGPSTSPLTNLNAVLTAGFIVTNQVTVTTSPSGLPVYIWSLQMSTANVL
jgi:hypothetical protein